VSNVEPPALEPRALELPAVAGLTIAERTDQGKEARKRRPRRSLGDWTPADDRPDPVALLEAQAGDRVPELLPLRYQRMAATPFTFYRGAAAVMARDLGGQEHSGLVVQLCGDAHLANFGGFASPERTLVYDINDFDETHPGPFEWDVQRLCASVELAGRNIGLSPGDARTIVVGTANAYRTAMATFASMSNLEVFYDRIDNRDVERMWVEEAGRKGLEGLLAAVAKGEAKDRLRAQKKLTRLDDDGHRYFRSQPPLLVPTTELFGFSHQQVDDGVDSALQEYRLTLHHASRRLFDRYRRSDLARKVVGVGSVGTRAWVALFEGRDDDDPLFLQVKEAVASVLEPFTGDSVHDHHGKRVVDGQRIIQATPDVLLGWTHGSEVIDGGPDRHYYVRQLWDWKTTADLDTMRERGLNAYSHLCGRVLARAHARSGDPVALAGYLGSSDRFDQAMGRFATTYADQDEQDHAAMLEAIESGRIVAADEDAP
jgi:uncharacterized protein (DUF2252 family)